MILVTGGTGFIGQAVVSSLLKSEKKVRMLARDVTKPCQAGAEVFLGDITKPGTLKGATEGIDTVIHMAGVISYNDSGNVINTNLEGTRNMLMQCSGIKRFVHASSVSVYGPHSGRVTEESKCAPLGDYGKSKLEAEELVEDSGVPYITLRIAPVYGEGSPWWTRILDHLNNGRPIPRSGNNVHLVHISDVADAVKLSIRNGARKGIYNISGEESIKFTDLAQELCKHLKKEPRYMSIKLARLLAKIGGSEQLLDVLIGNREYDTSKAKKLLKFRPKAKLSLEIGRMVNWYLDSIPAKA